MDQLGSFNCTIRQVHLEALMYTAVAVVVYTQEKGSLLPDLSIDLYECQVDTWVRYDMILPFSNSTSIYYQREQMSL